MAYIKTINSTQSAAAYFAGSYYQPCGTLVAPYGPYNRPISSGWVESWRGPRDTLKCRSFDRYSWKAGGTRDLWHCNPSGKMDGGPNWMLFLDGHGACRPDPQIGSDHFQIQQDEERYRTYQVSELFAKANEAVFDGATFLAELGETIVYMHELIRSVLRITKFTKDVIRRGANPDEAWLEWRYAIQPLMLTVEDIREALEGKRMPKEKVQQMKIYEPIKDKYQFVFVYSMGTLVFNLSKTTKFKSGAALWVESQLDKSPYGTSALDVLRAGWEVVPASFIIDWFIDIGGWLSQYRDTNLVVGERYATLVKETTVDIWLDTASSTACTEFISGPTELEPFTVKAYHINRIIGDAVSPAVLPSIVPSKLTLVRKMDALALTMSLIKGLRR